MLMTVVVSTFSSLLTVLIPVSLGKYYDLVFDFNSYRAKLFDFLPFDIGNSIESFLLFLSTLVLLKCLLFFAQHYSANMLAERLSFQLRNQLFEHQIRLPLQTYENKGIGKYLLRFSGDMGSIQKYFTKGIIQFVSDLFLFVFALFFFLKIHWILATLLFSGVLFSIFCLVLINKKLKPATTQRRNSKSGLLSFTNERLQVINTIQLLNRNSPEQSKFERKSEKVFQKGKAYHLWSVLAKTLVFILVYALLVGVLWFIYTLKNNETTLIDSGTLLVFVVLLITLLVPLRRLLRVNIVWELGNISFEKLCKVLNQAKAENISEKLTVSEGIIEFKNFSFYDENEQAIFENFNHTFSKGFNNLDFLNEQQKGVLSKCITLLYDNYKGVILIDGQNITQFSAKMLRKKITVVSSEFPLLGRTVFEAISYSRKVEKRSKATEILDLVQAKNPQNERLHLDDKLTVFGGNLSNVQLQNLLLARALLTNKPIVIIPQKINGLLLNLVKERCLVLLGGHNP